MAEKGVCAADHWDLAIILDAPTSWQLMFGTEIMGKGTKIYIWKGQMDNEKTIQMKRHNERPLLRTEKMN